MSETTFQDTPLYAWLRANAWYLLAGAAIVGGIVTYRNLSTQWADQARQESWDAYRALAGGAADGPALKERLVQAREDALTFPWFVLESTWQAAQSGDQEDLALLRPELEKLSQDSSIRVATVTGQQGMAAYMLRQLDAASGSPLPREFNSLEPQGGKIEIVVSVGPTDTYTLLAQLYEAECSLATSAFLKWIEAGRLAGQSARLMGSTGLALNLLKTEVAEGEAPPATLMVERPYGLFHEEGMISLVQLPGQFGAQDPNSVQLLLADQFQLDGQATVLAKVVEGMAPLKAALESAGPSAAVAVVSAKTL